MSLCDGRADALVSRRRNLAGPAGCGLCGIESLAAAVRTPPLVSSDIRVSAKTVFEQIAALRCAQPLNQETHAVHGAGFWSPHMRQRFLVLTAKDASGLKPLVHKALPLIHDTPGAS